MILLEALVGSILDRFRGSDTLLPKFLKLVALTFYIWSMTAIGNPLLFMLLLGLGYTSGWSMVGEWIRGEDRLRDEEWWQFGILKENMTLALIFRGLMMGLPLGLAGHLLGHQEWVAVAVAAAFVFPMSIFLTKHWEKAEYLRGAGIILGSYLLLLGM